MKPGGSCGEEPGCDGCELGRRGSDTGDGWQPGGVTTRPPASGCPTDPWGGLGWETWLTGRRKARRDGEGDSRTGQRELSQEHLACAPLQTSLVRRCVGVCVDVCVREQCQGYLWVDGTVSGCVWVIQQGRDGA